MLFNLTFPLICFVLQTIPLGISKSIVKSPLIISCCNSLIIFFLRCLSLLYQCVDLKTRKCLIHLLNF
jgi:hypothetical protein